MSPFGLGINIIKVTTTYIGFKLSTIVPNQ